MIMFTGEYLLIKESPPRSKPGELGSLSGRDSEWGELQSHDT